MTQASADAHDPAVPKSSGCKSELSQHQERLGSHVPGYVSPTGIGPNPQPGGASLNRHRRNDALAPEGSSVARPVGRYVIEATAVATQQGLTSAAYCHEASATVRLFTWTDFGCGVFTRPASPRSLRITRRAHRLLRHSQLIRRYWIRSSPNPSLNRSLFAHRADRRRTAAGPRRFCKPAREWS